MVIKIKFVNSCIYESLIFLICFDRSKVKKIDIFKINFIISIL